MSLKSQEQILFNTPWKGYLTLFFYAYQGTVCCHLPNIFLGLVFQLHRSKLSEKLLSNLFPSALSSYVSIVVSVLVRFVNQHTDDD